ncbi:phosphoserine phosphatase [Rhodoferax koreense]|uniref:Phosphoserine phosphatase n=1 Tax=Rhodoferax koreensis TaxID=1842727 RepID=A0A1P8JUQ7_9BURK|nr:HAD family hydrolase [Rhodoferax koreense]APW37483.1 phosphoserine phosphatase [Rhodoferax koreense]
MNSAKKKLVLFDLDHTLLAVDSDYTWGVFTTAIGWTDPVEFKRRNDEFYAHYKAGTLDIHDYVRFAVDAARRQGATKSIAAHADFMRDVVLPAITPAARALVKRHQDAGDEVVIVTATNEFVTRPIATEFGVTQLIAVELECEPIGEDGAGGWFTGAIKGVPSAREGKVTRVAQWLAERQLDWSDVEITFYTDSINDLALMEKVDHPVATNPDDRLRAVAVERGWPILELFQKQT